MTADALGTGLAFDVRLHHGNLLRQIEDGHLHLRIIAHTLQRPLACIAAHIVERAYMVLVEDNLQGLRE